MDMDLTSVRGSTLPARSGCIAARRELPDMVERHRKWLDSCGEEGERADFSGLELRQVDLTGADLRNAVFNKAALQSAELLMTDLRGASLLRANLEGADLLGAALQEANLQGANLENVKGLQVGQLAGANLYAAVLPPPVDFSANVKNLLQAARRATWLILGILLVYALALFRIFTTRDVQLIQNSSAIPLAGFWTLLPMIPFYLFGPVVLLGFHLASLWYLQRLWQGAASFPAVLPDGRSLDACLPWFSRWPARAHFQWLRKGALATLETSLSILLLYWVAPAVLLVFWARYLTLQDFRGTMLHVLLILSAIAVAMLFPRCAANSFYVNLGRAGSSPDAAFRLGIGRTAVMAGIGLALTALSAGAIFGNPHNSGAPRANGSNVREWAAGVFWLAGYSPTADLSGSDVSTKPPHWTDQAGELALIKGARLDRFSLRYLQGWAAFLAKANLSQADLHNAYLSHADLRQANLRQAALRYATLDEANFSDAVLQEADLRNANLIRANLQRANMAWALLGGSYLLDSRIDAANLYGADLRGAQLQRASLSGADLREANLEGADLTMAGLQGAYLSSAKMAATRLRGADFAHAFLTDTDLRGADLTAANLQGAILTGADLRGANLQGSLLQGEGTITARQLCSAANIAQIQMDDGLQREVLALCGGPPAPPVPGLANRDP